MSLLPRDLDLLRLSTHPPQAVELSWGLVHASGWSMGLLPGRSTDEAVLAVWRPEASWWDWYESFDASPLRAVPGSPEPEAMVAGGWVELAEALLSAVPVADQAGTGRSLQTELFAPPRGKSVLCTGFGSAGGLAQVLGCWVKESFPSRRVEARSFAAPAVGTRAFDRYADGLLDENVSWVFRDDLTAVAHADFERVSEALQAGGRLDQCEALRERLSAAQGPDGLVLGAGTRLIEAPPDSALPDDLEWPDYLEASGDPRRYARGLGVA